jgi:hypothetical protein
MDFEKSSHNINVQMTGKEYIEYKKNLFKFPKQLIIFLKAALPYWLSALTIMIGVLFIVDMFPKAPIKPAEYFILFGIPILKSMPSFILMLGAIAWLIHGVGFVIIKR